MNKPLYIKGMHGLGDNLHQRAIIRELYDSHDIYLETSWPQVYHDFPDVKFIAKGTRLRTQLKNQSRANQQYHSIQPYNAKTISIQYKPHDVISLGGVLPAMIASAQTNNIDFSFEPKLEWIESAKELIGNINKPILIYRPLIVRKEWGGCHSRNPDIQHYKELFEEFSKDFFVISIADLVPNVEWQVSLPIKADLEFHKGELSFEQIAGLFHLSSLVYCSPGFSAVLARSMGKPLITVFGGYENSNSFNYGYGPYLGIDTIKPCQCFSHNHKCNKSIDLKSAKLKIRNFINENVKKS